jgi:hypothetical protein
MQFKANGDTLKFSKGPANCYEPIKGGVPFVGGDRERRKAGDLFVF